MTSPPRPDLASLLRRDPRLARLLNAYGVHVCAGCILTLTSPVERAAAFHGVPDIPGFLRALGLRPGKGAHRRHGRRAGAKRRVQGPRRRRGP